MDSWFKEDDERWRDENGISVDFYLIDVFTEKSNFKVVALAEKNQEKSVGFVLCD